MDFEKVIKINVTVSASERSVDRTLKCLILECQKTLRSAFTHMKGFDYYYGNER